MAKKIWQWIANDLSQIDETINVLNGRTPVYKLGIQAPPGVKFYINKTNSNTNDTCITMGAYGIYELDFSDGIGQITSLHFKNLSDTEIELINENNTFTHILVDIVYEDLPFNTETVFSKGEMIK